MRKHYISIAVLLLFCFGAGPVFAKPGLRVEFETGAANAGYNNIEIPRGAGTRFSLTDDLDSDMEIYYRLRLGYRINDRHELLALFAPLVIHSEGSIGRPIVFEGTTFPADTPLKAKYKFNSYRLTYRYHFDLSPKIRAAIGVTAKIRDAAIRLSDSTQKAEKTNVGFVPLISFLFNYDISDGFRFYIDGDALAAPQGRAEDVKAAFEFDTDKNMSFNIGYRILEGGADVDEVYNFALINYAVIGMTYRF